MEQVAVAFTQAFGDLFGVGVNRCQIRSCGIVAAEPDECADGVGEPAAGLGHEPESGLLGGDGALVDVGLAFPFEVHGAPAVGAGVAAGSDVHAHIHRRAFIVVAHHVGDVLDADLAGRLHEERHFALEVVAHCVFEPVGGGAGHFCAAVHIGELAVAEDVEGGPGTGFAAACAAEIEGIVDVAEAEIFVGAGVPALLPGEADYVGGVEAVVGVIEGEAGDTGLVGVGADVAVGDAAGHPDNALVAAGALAHEVHDPGLLRVGDAEGFAFGGVAVFVGEGHDGLYGLTGGAGTLEGDVDQ